jgi:hypothetical protein
MSHIVQLLRNSPSQLAVEKVDPSEKRSHGAERVGVQDVGPIPKGVPYGAIGHFL